MLKRKPSSLNIEELLTNLKTMKERIEEWFKGKKKDSKKLEPNK
jgi:hypothetical protein